MHLQSRAWLERSWYREIEAPLDSCWILDTMIGDYGRTIALTQLLRPRCAQSFTVDDVHRLDQLRPWLAHAFRPQTPDELEQGDPTPPGAAGVPARSGQMILKADRTDKGDRMRDVAAFCDEAVCGHPWRKAALSSLLLASALLLAGCESSGILTRPGKGVAEVANQSAKEAATNLASLTDVVQRNPASSEAYNTRAVAYARIGKFQEAIADFSQAIKLEPNNAAALTNRALAYRQINRDDVALPDFNRAIETNPKHAPAYLGRANLLRAEGKLDDARADLDHVIKLNPGSAQAYHARGLIYQREGLHEQAITDFDNAIDRDPFAGAPYQARGESLIAIGKSDKAIADFNAALNVDSKNAEAWAGLGLAYEKSGDRAKAIESYQRALSFDPNSQIAKAGLARTGRG